MCMHIVHVCLHNRQQQKENAIVIFKEEMKSRNKVRYAAKPAKMTIMKLKSMTSRIFITLNQIAHLLSVQSKLQIKWDCHIFNILIGTIMLSLLSPRYNIRMGLSVICSITENHLTLNAYFSSRENQCIFNYQDPFYKAYIQEWGSSRAFDSRRNYFMSVERFNRGPFQCISIDFSVNTNTKPSWIIHYL